MQVPFVDLKRAYSPVVDVFLEDVKSLLDKGDFVYSPRIKKFEEEAAAYLNVSKSFCVSSGTSALEVAFRAIELKPYDKVLVPANSFIATAFAVSNVGGIPIFMDVDSKTWNVTLDIVKEAIENNGKIAAVAVVHLFGRPIDKLKDIYEYCNSKGIYLIEDCAQAFGAKADYKDAHVGTIGHIGAYSFYPAKNLGTIGNGGLVVSKNQFSDYIRKTRAYGEDTKYHSVIKGSNYNMSTIQALYLSRMLPLVDDLNLVRRISGELYIKLFKEYGLNEHVSLPEASSRNVYHLFPIKVKTEEIRNKLKEHLSSKGIGVAIHYPIPIHKQGAYREFNELSLPVTEELALTSLSLPMFAYISPQEIEYVVKSIVEFFEGK